jgi:hypothetical protein
MSSICGDPRAKPGSAPPIQPQAQTQPQPLPQAQTQQRTLAQSTSSSSSQPVDDLSRLFSGILSVPVRLQSERYTSLTLSHPHPAHQAQQTNHQLNMPDTPTATTLNPILAQYLPVARVRIPILRPHKPLQPTLPDPALPLPHLSHSLKFPYHPPNHL